MTLSGPAGRPDTVWFGGDYNPEQWPAEVWAEDAALMRAAGATMATVGVFSWADPASLLVVVRPVRGGG